MKKILYTQFHNIDDLIDELSQTKEFKKAIRRSNLYKFWKMAVGEKFSQISKPFSMLKGDTMVIACQTPIVAQELMLRKAQILQKLQPFTSSLHLTVKDLKFDPKKWTD